jgi:hypothetical protein
VDTGRSLIQRLCQSIQPLLVEPEACPARSPGHQHGPTEACHPGVEEQRTIVSSDRERCHVIQRERPQPLPGMSTPAAPVCGRSGFITLAW